MTFEEYLKKMNLPNTAKVQLPGVLSEEVKRKLMKITDAEGILKSAIDEINHGSIDSVDALVRKKL